MKIRTSARVSRRHARSGVCGSPRSGLRIRDGFSLVEVTIALGIIGFCLTTLLGLMGVGVTMSRSAMDRTVSAQIGQRLVGMAQQTDWSRKGELQSQYYYFDGDGQPLDASEVQHAVFSAAILIDDSVQVPGDAGVGTNDRLAKVLVRVVKDPGHKLQGAPSAGQLEASLKANSSEFAALLADNGA